MPGISNLNPITTFGQQAGVRAPNILPTPAAGSAATSVSAPPNATSAPKGNSKYVYTGLCAALNQAEQELVQKGTVEIANTFEVQFSPPSLAQSKVKVPGSTDYSSTPMENSSSASLNPASNSMNTTADSRAVSQGTQVVQVIELVMRNSDFITNQQNAIVNQESGNLTPNAKANSSKSGDTQWFKISVNSLPIGDKIDSKRNTYAYRTIYTVTPYALTDANSQFFPVPKFRGVHKVYNYWFTGQNTQVLHYEQNFTALWHNVSVGIAPETQTVSTQPGLSQQLLEWVYPTIPMTAAAQSDQGGKKGSLNPAASLADFLYSRDDQAKITLKIVGDPAWILQGEVTGITGSTFQFGGFYPDGTINTDAQDGVFVVNWNAPEDYDLSTGLMDINATGTNYNNSKLSTTSATQSAAYSAVNVKHTFRQGMFEQELTGVLLTNLSQQQLASINGTGRPQSVQTNMSNSRQPNLKDAVSSLDSGVTSALSTINTIGSKLKTAGSALLNNLPSPSYTTPVLLPADPVPAAPPNAPSSNGQSVETPATETGTNNASFAPAQTIAAPDDAGPG